MSGKYLVYGLLFLDSILATFLQTKNKLLPASHFNFIEFVTVIGLAFVIVNVKWLLSVWHLKHQLPDLPR